MANLILNIPAKDIRAARRIAKENKTTVSEWFLNYIFAMDRLSSARTLREGEIGPLTRKLSGIISNPEGKTDRQMIEDALMEKHGLSD